MFFFQLLLFIAFLSRFAARCSAQVLPEPDGLSQKFHKFLHLFLLRTILCLKNSIDRTNLSRQICSTIKSAAWRISKMNNPCAISNEVRNLINAVYVDTKRYPYSWFIEAHASIILT